MNTKSENDAVERSASAVSRFVSWYSGAKLAHTSTPYADQPMMNSHISATEMLLKYPPFGFATCWYVMFELCQSPVKYGSTMKIEQAGSGAARR